MSDPMSVFGGEADTAKRWAMSAFDPPGHVAIEEAA
jgi:hypothetical protein